MEVHESHLRSELRDPNPKTGVWGNDRRNVKNRIFRREGGI